MAQPIFLAIWTHKGGAGKTSTTCSLAYSFASRGHNVLVVDCDSQKDLTYMMFGDAIDAPPYNGDTKKFITRPDPLAPDPEAPGVRTIFDATYPLFGPAQGQLVTPTPENKLPAQNGWGKIDVILGHHRTGTLNIKIAQAYSQFAALPFLLNYPGAPFKAIEQCAVDNNSQIVLLDLPPDAQLLTASLLMQCDFWVSPVMADCLSLEALYNQTDKVCFTDYPNGMGPGHAPVAGINGPPDDERSWVEMHREWVARTGQQQQGALHPVRDAMPKFLGVVISAFISRNRNEPPLPDLNTFSQGVAMDLPARNIEHWMNKIWDATHTIVSNSMLDLVPRLANGHNMSEKHQLAVPYDTYRTMNITPILGRIKHFGQLGAIAHHVHKPVPFLEKTDIGTFKTDGTFERKRKVSDTDSTWQQVLAFRGMFDQMAWNILALMHHSEHPSMPNMPADRLSAGLGGPPDDTVFLTEPVPPQ
jgi:cellulose biosynthesis protein BcsQ